MRKSTHTAEYGILREQLVAVRRRDGLSQRELGARLRVPHTWVAKVESGERRIDLVEFAWFCAACGAEAQDVAAAVFEATARNGERGRKPGRRP